MTDLYLYLYDYPRDVGAPRGPGYWLHPANALASRRKFRIDRSNEWRHAFDREEAPRDPTRTEAFSALLRDRLIAQPRTPGDDVLLRFIVLADTGEGDRSQFALLPAIHALSPDFMIINGDVAYPAGRLEDYDYGFFRPYAGLNIPIWATPGNHEYYSSHRGEEFFEVFCTRRHERRWQASGLRLVPQPGTYWMLREPGLPLSRGGQSQPLRFAVMGIDTGHSGNLDGNKRLGFGQDEDIRQHSWIDERLSEADAAGIAVLVLFHIPALVDGNRKKVRLDKLHRILASHPSVRLVICGHIHNLQVYAAEGFARFLEDTTSRVPRARPEYLVSGAGGAFLGSTDFKEGPYPPTSVFPTADEWRAFAKRGEAALRKLGIGRTAFHRVAGAFEKDVLSDYDPVEFCSMIVVDVKADGAIVRPLCIRNLEQCYPQFPPGTTIALADSRFRLDEAVLQACFQIVAATAIVY